MKVPMQHERRDWALLVFILPLGIVLMLLAGQLAIRLLPNWSVFADISSNVNPGDYLNEQPDSFAPVRPEILTPMAWEASFLTPEGTNTEPTVVPLVVLDPSSTPTATPVASATPSPSPTPPTETPSATASPPVTASPTRKPRETDPPPTATPSPTSSPPPTSTAVTLPTVTPAAGEPDVQAPPDNTIFTLPDGYAIIIDLGIVNAIIVTGNPEPNYDLVYYERLLTSPAPNHIQMDWIQIDVAVAPTGPAYTVFFWGNGVRDTNTNVDTADIGVPTAEVDNQIIPASNLYGTSPQTGILIDVDGAPTPPPPNIYQFVIISAPTGAGSGNDGTDIDAVQTVDVTPSP